MKLIAAIAAVFIAGRLLKAYNRRRFLKRLKPGLEVTVKIGSAIEDGIIREQRSPNYFTVETDKNYYTINKKQIYE